MAGWKLRKDKTQTETPTPENGAEAPSPATEFAAPREAEPVPAAALDDEVELLPLPATRWDLPAEDEPVSLAETTHEKIAPEAIELEDEETKPGRVFDLGDPGLSPAEAEALLAEEEYEPVDLQFEEDELPPAFTPNAPAPPEALAAPETHTEAAPEPLPTFTEAEPMPEAVALPPTFTPTEPAPEAVAAAPPVVEAPALPSPAEGIAVPPPPAFSVPEPETTPTPTPPPVPATPLFAAPPVFTAPPAAPESFTSTLRLDRSELPPILPQTPQGTSVPTVSPFILDVPPPAAPAGETSHRLVVHFGRLSAPFPLAKDVTVIGRPDSEMHYYPDIEIELDDAVSRRHAEVLRREDGYYLADAGSTNGTMLNGEALAPHEERLLAHGDRIRVGERTEIIFE